MEAEEDPVFAGVGHQAILVCNIHSSPRAEVVWYRGTLLLENDNRMYREVVGTRHTLTMRVYAGSGAEPEMGTATGRRPARY